jgi:hypothetical protein
MTLRQNFLISRSGWLGLLPGKKGGSGLSGEIDTTGTSNSALSGRRSVRFCFGVCPLVQRPRRRSKSSLQGLAEPLGETEWGSPLVKSRDLVLFGAGA